MKDSLGGRVTKPLEGRTLVVAFEGWSDARDAATLAVRYLSETFDAEQVISIESEDYFDFQFNRPIVMLDEDGDRNLSWPTVELWAPSGDSVLPGADRFYFLVGAEPSRRWKSFVAEIADLVVDYEIDAVVFLGAFVADAPHTRPIQVSATSPNELLQNEFTLEASTYQGPVGIISVLGVELERIGIPTMAIWAAVPAYVHVGPSPKATLSLVAEVERFTGISVDHGELPDEAFKWERSIDEMVEGDEELLGYIEQLEEARDSEGLENTSGDALALEFERYLRQKDDGAQ
jgi:predicted ATP-grasp superfamily ATP-dependent carboligase